MNVKHLSEASATAAEPVWSVASTVFAVEVASEAAVFESDSLLAAEQAGELTTGLWNSQRWHPFCFLFWSSLSLIFTITN